MIDTIEQQPSLIYGQSGEYLTATPNFSEQLQRVQTLVIEANSSDLEPIYIAAAIVGAGESSDLEVSDEEESDRKVIDLARGLEAADRYIQIDDGVPVLGISKAGLVAGVAAGRSRREGLMIRGRSSDSSSSILSPGQLDGVEVAVPTETDVTVKFGEYSELEVAGSHFQHRHLALSMPSFVQAPHKPGPEIELLSRFKEGGGVLAVGNDAVASLMSKITDYQSDVNLPLHLVKAAQIAQPFLSLH